MRPALTVVAAIAALAFAGSAGAKASATADLSIKWVVIPSKAVAGTPFSFQIGLVNGGPDVGSARTNIRMPPGAERSGGLLECSSEGQVEHCDEFAAVVGDNGSATVSFTVTAPGVYTFVLFLDRLTATDPNLADNTDTVTITVGAKPVAVVGPALRTARPHAGRPFVVSVDVNGAAIDNVRCTTSIGKATPSATGARAFCRVSTPRSARGKSVRVTVTITAGGRAVSRVIRVGLS